MNKTLAALAGLGVLLLGAVIFLQWGAAGTALLWHLSHEGTWLLPLVVVASLIDSINPCAFSVLVVTIAFLFSLGKLRSNILRIGGSYILGIFVVYTLIGLGILQVLHLFDTPHFMAKVGAGVLIGLGLVSLANHFLPAFPLKPKIPAAAHHRMATLMETASLPSAFLLGGLVGLCEFPCTGGPYLMVLGLLYDQTTFAAGLGYLMLYNTIFVLPLGIILFISGDKSLVRKVEEWKREKTKTMRLGGGTAMVALGLIVFNL
jgi:cytochrome c-type biogenesis protein